MSDQYIGEIRYFPYLRGAPQGWLVCDGSLQSLAAYQALGALLGTTYGGDGQSQFGLPDLRGRVAIGASPSYPLGNAIGTETVTLNIQQLPVHGHSIEASTVAATATDPTGMVYAAGTGEASFYLEPSSANFVDMSPAMVGSAGQNLPHENCAPTLPIVACIAWDGVWPPQNN